MTDLLSKLLPHLPDDAATWLTQALARVEGDGCRCVPELFPQLPRRVGRTGWEGARFESGECEIDLGCWRSCDIAALALLTRSGAPDEVVVDLFLHGDLEERTMVLRSLAMLPITDATVQLFGEAQRSNTLTHFEAAVCDSNIVVRAHTSGALPEADFNRIALKLAFMDLELDRMFGAIQLGNPELSRMLQGLASEREAAGRAVWTDTNRLIARAPAPGTLARLVGHLEHGSDGHRLAAAEGLEHIDAAELAPFVADRLTREPRAEIRAALQRFVARHSS